MDLNEEIYDFIERYLNGELQGAELSEFERKIESIPELKEEIKLQKELQDFFDGEVLEVEKSDVELENFLNSKEANDVQNILNNTLKKQKQKNKKEINKSEHKKINWKLLALPLAASILFLIAFFYFNNENADVSPQEIFAEYYKPEEISITEKGSTKETLSEIENDFNSGNYSKLEKTIPSLLDTLTDKDNFIRPTLNLAEGIVALELDKNDEAIAIFKDLKNSGSLNVDEVSWYYILTLLKKGDRENAIIEINNYLKTSYKYKKKELNEILKDLN